MGLEEAGTGESRTGKHTDRQKALGFCLPGPAGLRSPALSSGHKANALKSKEPVVVCQAQEGEVCCCVACSDDKSSYVYMIP